MQLRRRTRSGAGRSPVAQTTVVRCVEALDPLPRFASALSNQRNHRCVGRTSKEHRFDQRRLTGARCSEDADSRAASDRQQSVDDPNPRPQRCGDRASLARLGRMEFHRDAPTTKGRAAIERTTVRIDRAAKRARSQRERAPLRQIVHAAIAVLSRVSSRQSMLPLRSCTQTSPGRSEPSAMHSRPRASSASRSTGWARMATAGSFDVRSWLRRRCSPHRRPRDEARARERRAL